MTAKRLDVSVTLDITDGGKPFNHSVVTWSDVPYEGVLEIQKNMIDVLERLNQLGYSIAAASNPPTVGTTPPASGTKR